MMRSKTRRKGYIAMKVNLVKAYDRLLWGFIEDTLDDVGFLPYPSKLL